MISYACGYTASAPRLAEDVAAFVSVLTPPSAGPKGSDHPSASLGALGQEPDAKFKAAQAKAKLKGVDALTQEDVEGLSREQLKELRGY